MTKLSKHTQKWSKENCSCLNHIGFEAYLQQLFMENKHLFKQQFICVFYNCLHRCNLLFTYNTNLVQTWLSKTTSCLMPGIRDLLEHSLLPRQAWKKDVSLSLGNIGFEESLYIICVRWFHLADQSRERIGTKNWFRHRLKDLAAVSWTKFRHLI